MKNLNTALGVFLFVTGMLSAAWFLTAFRTAGLLYVQDSLLFIAHWMSELLISILGFILAFVLFFTPKTPRIGVLFLLGMILSASSNAAFYYSVRAHNPPLACIAGMLFLCGIAGVLFCLRHRGWRNETFLAKFGLLALGVLINFHLDLIVPHIQNRLWAAFLNSLFLLSAGAYLLIRLLCKKEKAVEESPIESTDPERINDD